MTSLIDIFLGTMIAGLLIATGGIACLQAVLLTIANCLPFHGECPCTYVIDRLDFGRFAHRIAIDSPQNAGFGMALEILSLIREKGDVAPRNESQQSPHPMTLTEVADPSLTRLIQRLSQIVQDLRKEECPGCRTERSPP